MLSIMAAIVATTWKQSRRPECNDDAGKAERPDADQSGAEHAAAQARHVPDQSRHRLRDERPRRPARHHLAEHGGAGEAFRRDGIRGAGAGRALDGLGRQAQSAGAGLRGLHLGRRDLRLDPHARRGLDLAHHHQPSDHRGQAVGGDRPHLGRALHPQRRHRLGAAGDRDVQPAVPLPRGALRLRRGVARDHQAAVDRGRTRSTTRAGSSRSRRAISRRSRSSTRTPRS